MNRTCRNSIWIHWMAAIFCQQRRLFCMSRYDSPSDRNRILWKWFLQNSSNGSLISLSSSCRISLLKSFALWNFIASSNNTSTNQVESIRNIAWNQDTDIECPLYWIIIQQWYKWWSNNLLYRSQVCDSLKSVKISCLCM